MSVQQLSDACSELGLPIARSVLANFESGRRPTISVPELLVLAKALGVPPMALMFPVGYEDETEVLPGRKAHPVTALRWASGEGYLPGQSEEETAANRASWRKSAIGWVRKLMRDAEQLRLNRRRSAELHRLAAEATSAEARNAYLGAAQQEDERVASQTRLLERWHIENERAGIKSRVPALYGEVPVTLLGALPAPEEDEDDETAEDGADELKRQGLASHVRKNPDGTETDISHVRGNGDPWGKQ